MLGITDYWSFVVAVLVFLALPGPGTLALLTSTGQGGFRAGAAATFGLIAGDQVLLWLAALGVAAVLQGHPILFKTLQYAGAGYLVYVGLRLIVRRGAEARLIRLDSGHYFRQLFVITLLNPKAIVFYMAFFPLFIDPATQRGVVTFGAMAVTIAALSLAYCLTLVAFAHALTERVKAHRRLARALERLAGLVLVAFGVRLAQ
jgi:threonine/homoserine/homoserine lactone efflux protein